MSHWRCGGALKMLWLNGGSYFVHNTFCCGPGFESGISESAPGELQGPSQRQKRNIIESYKSIIQKLQYKKYNIKE